MDRNHYQTSYQAFITSSGYLSFEQDIIYQRLRELLLRHLTDQAFLDIEELLHAEILLKLEFGFQHGYHFALTAEPEPKKDHA